MGGRNAADAAEMVLERAGVVFVEPKYEPRRPVGGLVDSRLGIHR